MIAGGLSDVVDLGRDSDTHLRRLRAALALGQGFQLVVVEAEPGPIRREVIRRIQTWTGRESSAGLVVVSLNARATLAAQLQGTSGAIVTGLEPPSSSEAPVRDWLAELNWSRDALPELVPGPFVLVISQTIHRAMFDHAPDLYSWRRHTAPIAVIVPALALPLSSPGDRYWLAERDRLSIIVEAAGNALSRAVSLTRLAEVLLELNDESGASRVLDELQELTTSLPQDQSGTFYGVYGRLLRAECALRRRDFAVAETLLDDAARHIVEIDALWRLERLLRAFLHGMRGDWEAAAERLAPTFAVPQLRSAGGAQGSVPVLIRGLRALEYACQIAFARGDILYGRLDCEFLIDRCLTERAGQWDRWGPGMLVRLARAIADVYPDDGAALVNAALAAKDSPGTETLVALHGLKAKCALLLEHTSLAREALAEAKRWVRSDDTVETQALLSLCEAQVALATGSDSEDAVASLLERARVLLPPAMPRQASLAGSLLGALWTARRCFELATVAYRIAAQDARAAGDLELAADAELGELRSAIDGGLEPGDTPARLQGLADQLHAAERDQSEGVARASLGGYLLRHGVRESAVVELERARACFAATTDAAAEHAVASLLESGS